MTQNPQSSTWQSWFHEQVEKAAKKAGSKKKLAQQIGIDRTNFSKYTADEDSAVPGFDTVLKILEYLKTPPHNISEPGVKYLLADRLQSAGAKQKDFIEIEAYSVQELSARNDQLEKENAILRQQVEEMTRALKGIAVSLEPLRETLINR